MVTTTKTSEPASVRLSEVWRAVGGTYEGVTAWAGRAKAEIFTTWDGQPAVSVEDAREIKRLADEYKAKSHAIAEGYKRYQQEREVEKQRIRQEKFKVESDRLLIVQRETMRAEAGRDGRPFLTAGSTIISLDPRARSLANDIANEAVEQWTKQSRELSQDEWARKAGLE
jgi:hypothetical protein